MKVVIGLLRGVNLGGHRKVAMADLRALCESMGLREPQTYVQSGNVLFKTAERNLSKLAAQLEDAIERRFGFRSEVILRTAAEMREVVVRNPFAGRSGIEPNKLLVTFLAAAPSSEARAKVLALSTESEELHLHDREFFVYYANGLARPKVAWTAVAAVLKVAGTGRNWNTVVKLAELAERM
jgi:uncharacterized protein (DUF1697 family)